jgi:hypothetical protein
LANFYSRHSVVVFDDEDLGDDEGFYPSDGANVSSGMENSSEDSSSDEEEGLVEGEEDYDEGAMFSDDENNNRVQVSSTLFKGVGGQRDTFAGWLVGRLCDADFVAA